MHTLVRYQCEICLGTYDDPAAARACEAQGLPAPVPWLPLADPPPRWRYVYAVLAPGPAFKRELARNEQPPSSPRRRSSTSRCRSRRGPPSRAARSGGKK